MKTYSTISAKTKLKLVAKISALGVSLVAVTYAVVWTLLSAVKVMAELVSR